MVFMFQNTISEEIKMLRLKTLPLLVIIKIIKKPNIANKYLTISTMHLSFSQTYLMGEKTNHLRKRN